MNRWLPPSLRSATRSPIPLSESRRRGAGSMVCCVLLGALGMGVSGAEASPPSPSPEFDSGSVVLRDGVLVDEDRSGLFLMSPAGGIESLDPATGDTHWRSTLADRPLALVGPGAEDRDLLAQVDGEAALVGLDAEGGAVLRRIPLTVPEKAHLGVDDVLGRRLLLDVVPAPDGHLLARWQLETEKVKAVRPWERPDPPGSDPRLASAPLPRKQVRSGAQLLLGNGASVEGRAPSKLTAEALAADFELRRQGPRQFARAAAASSMAQGERFFLSADGRHLLHSRRAADTTPRAANDDGWSTWEWRILDRENGSELGSLRSHFARASFLVVDRPSRDGGPILVFDQPPYDRMIEGELHSSHLRILAIDLASGAELWHRDLRDTTFRGPFPP